MSLRNIPDEVLDHILSLVYWRSSTPDFLKLRLVCCAFIAPNLNRLW